jgi:hypothetical protein
MEVPEDIREKAKAVRDKLCIESECTFDRGCGCLDALTEALLSERLAQKERDAKIAEHRALVALGLTPQAVFALLDALPDAIRNSRNSIMQDLSDEAQAIERKQS